MPSRRARKLYLLAQFPCTVSQKSLTPTTSFPYLPPATYHLPPIQTRKLRLIQQALIIWIPCRSIVSWSAFISPLNHWRYSATPRSIRLGYSGSLLPTLTLFCHSGIFPRISGITANVKSTFQPGLTEES